MFVSIFTILGYWNQVVKMKKRTVNRYNQGFGIYGFYGKDLGFVYVKGMCTVLRARLV
jgi:hypothetical protein